MNDNRKIIRDIVRKESLRIMKESQASFLAESSPADTETKNSMKRVNDYIGLLEKNLEKLNMGCKNPLKLDWYTGINAREIINAYIQDNELEIEGEVKRGFVKLDPLIARITAQPEEGQTQVKKEFLFKNI